MKLSKKFLEELISYEEIIVYPDIFLDDNNLIICSDGLLLSAPKNVKLAEEIVGNVKEIKKSKLWRVLND